MLYGGLNANPTFPAISTTRALQACLVSYGPKVSVKMTHPLGGKVGFPANMLHTIKEAVNMGISFYIYCDMRQLARLLYAPFLNYRVFVGVC
jgi:hypothetical protein